MTRLDFQSTLRREVQIRNRIYVLEMNAGSVTFREKGRRSRMSLGWLFALQCAEPLAGEEAHRERLRDRAIARGGR